VSDGLGITAQGLPTLERVRTDDDVAHLRDLAEEYEVGLVLVGKPLSSSGGETAMSQRASEFAAKLRKHLPCPVEMWDERLTSAEANRMLRGSGISIGKRAKAVDRVAATLLLQSYLDHRALEEARASTSGAAG
jgi:putative pre-16S rRNA nuclease